MMNEGVLMRLVERMAGNTLVCLLLNSGDILHEAQCPCSETGEGLSSQLTLATPTLLHVDATNCTHFMQVIHIE